MFPASTKGGGTAFAFPDTCNVPAAPSPIPTPFPNTAELMQASDCTSKVKIVNKPVVHKGSKVPRSMGDEAGTAGGVTSGMNMGEVQFKLGVSKVKVEGNDIVNQLKMTAHNGASANMPAGSIVAPSQTKVIVMG